MKKLALMFGIIAVSVGVIASSPERLKAEEGAGCWCVGGCE